MKFRTHRRGLRAIITREAAERTLGHFGEPQTPEGQEARNALAEQFLALKLPVVEDNPYGDLWYDAPPPDRKSVV